jgi:hypothetical protein
MTPFIIKKRGQKADPSGLTISFKDSEKIKEPYSGSFIS